MASRQSICGKSNKRSTSSISINSNNAEAYLCEIIDLELIVIVLRSSIKEICDDIVVINYDGQLHKGKILFRGTKVECQKQWQDIIFSQQMNENINENDENDEEAVTILGSSQAPSSMKRKTGQKRQHEDHDNAAVTTNPTNNLSTNKKKKRQIITSTDPDGNDSVMDEIGQTRGSISIDKIEQLFHSLEKTNQENFRCLNKKLESKLRNAKFDLNSYHDTNEAPSMIPVIFNNIDLTTFVARDPAHFARRLMRILYTNEELASSLLPDRPSETRKHYTKHPLDEVRFEILHRALRTKYGISGPKYDEFYEKCVRRSLIDLLQSCRKKMKKSQMAPVPFEQFSADAITCSTLIGQQFSPIFNALENI